MNASLRLPLLPDTQSQLDSRNLRLDAAGIKGLRYPITIRSGHYSVATIASFSMTVSLSAQSRGTHMSRFIELLEAQTEALNQTGFRAILFDMLERLRVRSGVIEMRFPYFVRKVAPVSGIQSRLDYEVCWRGCVSDDGQYSFRMHVAVPATSLCPCSKAISTYGAHNQRSAISIEVALKEPMAIEDLISVAERSASCEVYALLKRADEQYVTERAYDNPRFVEDLVRDVALELNREPRVGAYVIEAENFESIHNHSAYARLERPVSAIGSAESVKHRDPHLGCRQTGESR